MISINIRREALYNLMGIHWRLGSRVAACEDATALHNICIFAIGIALMMDVVQEAEGGGV